MQKIYFCVCDVIYVYNICMYVNEYVHTINAKNICLCIRCYICIQHMYGYERNCIYDKCIKIYVCVWDIIYVYNLHMYMNEYVYTINAKNICLCMRLYICIQLMYVYERICIYDKCKKYMSVFAMFYMYTTYVFI